ncbi:unnamed protein product [Amoebophrya sp. A120]|nr:unnamed protein product [Amoebophrya sp. A120]|eukprot:GSA120T00004663001.1
MTTSRNYSDKYKSPRKRARLRRPGRSSVKNNLLTKLLEAVKGRIQDLQRRVLDPFFQESRRNAKGDRDRQERSWFAFPVSGVGPATSTSPGRKMRKNIDACSSCKARARRTATHGHQRGRRETSDHMSGRTVSTRTSDNSSCISPRSLQNAVGYSCGCRTRWRRRTAQRNGVAAGATSGAATRATTGIINGAPEDVGARRSCKTISSTRVRDKNLPSPSTSLHCKNLINPFHPKEQFPIFLSLFLYLQTFLNFTFAAYFHVPPVDSTWVRPLILPWEPVRGTKDAILVTWTTGWNPNAAVLRSVLQRRYPVAIGSMNIDLRNRNQESATWYNSTEQFPGFSPWETVYEGPGKQFENTNLLPGHPYEFRVKTIGRNILKSVHLGENPDTESEWSVPQMAHTNYDPIRERFPILLQGMSAHNPDYAIIEIDRIQVYRRRDEKGLVLAVFSRWNMQLIWLKTYNTFNYPGDSNAMAKDIRRLDQSHFIAVVSTDAWEWNVTPSLIKAMEFCGAFHFATWSRNYGGSHIKMPTQTGFDVDQTSSQKGFGNPYAFWGIPGSGTGMGFESVAWPTSAYLMQKLAPNAIVRLILYMDYVVRHYFVSLPSVQTVSTSFHTKALPPTHESLHNPYTYAQRQLVCEGPNCNEYQVGVKSYIQEDDFYKVYNGELRVHMDRLLEANRTVDPHYYHFFLFTNSSIYKFDPRPAETRVTELERVWGGPSERFHFNVSAQAYQLSVFQEALPSWFPERTGIPYRKRYCPDLFRSDRFDINPITCRNTSRRPTNESTLSPDNSCCDYLDWNVGGDPSRDYFLGLRCGVGVVPTLCNETLTSFLPSISHKPPFNHTMGLGTPLPPVFSKLPPTQSVMAAMLGFQNPFPNGHFHHLATV